MLNDAKEDYKGNHSPSLAKSGGSAKASWAKLFIIFYSPNLPTGKVF